jgi:hypothetical protein
LTATAAEVLRARSAAPPGTTVSALSLLRGTAKAISDEADAARDDGLRERLTYLVADLLDAADDVEAL